MKNLKSTDASSETLLAWGGKCVKVDDSDEWAVKGALVRFTDATDPDLVKQFFTAKSDYGDHTESPIYFDHGLDKAIKKVVIGHGVLKVDDEAVWIEGHLDKKNKYAQKVQKLRKAMEAKGEYLGWSSGTASYLVETEDVKDANGVKVAEWIKKWPLGLDATLTPTPCDPENKIMPIKSYKGVDIKELLPEQDGSVENEENDTQPFKYDETKKMGHTLCAKLAHCHSRITSELLNQGGIGLNEYSGMHSGYADAVSAFHDSMGDVASRPVDRWDAEDMSYKMGPMVKTIGDVYHAALTRAGNAGLDHLLVRGCVSKDEHSSMKEGLDGHIDKFINDMDGDIRDRKLDAIGSPWLPMKTISGEVMDRGSMKLADEAETLLGGVDACIKSAAKLQSRFDALKHTRDEGRLGAKATGHVHEAIDSLNGLIVSLKSLIESKTDFQAVKDRLESAKAFAQKFA